MNKKIFFVIYIVTVLSVSTFYILTAINNSIVPAKAAFGISPPYIDETKLHPGDNVTDYITLMRSNTENEAPVSMTLKAPGIDSWIELSPKNLNFSKGKSHVILALKIIVPKEAIAGVYKGKLFTTLGQNKKNGVAVALGGLININLRVVK
jgi:hypothetical protein